MRRFVVLIAALISFGLMGGCINQGHMSAAGDLFTAATITNQELIELSTQARAFGDSQATIAPPSDKKYAQRLARLTRNLKNEDGLDLDFKVYLTPEINANAMADGSIRVYSGLMDMMTDNELFFVLGHEIGHVKNGHTLNRFRMAYASSGVVKAAAASNQTAKVVLNDAELGGLLHEVLNAQFSQKQELDADEYGYNLLKKYKKDPKAAVAALVKLSGDGGLMSSHPASADRAKQIKALMEKDAQ